MTSQRYNSRRFTPTVKLVLALLLPPFVEGWVPSAFVQQRHATRTASSTARFTEQEASKKYNLGLGRNRPIPSSPPFSSSTENTNTTLATPNSVPPDDDDNAEASRHWVAPIPVTKPPGSKSTTSIMNGRVAPRPADSSKTTTTTAGATNAKWVRSKRLISRNEDSKRLRGAVWDEAHYQDRESDRQGSSWIREARSTTSSVGPAPPKLLYPDIDLSIPDTIYSGTHDAVWDLLRYEAYCEAQREPLLVSFLHSTILNHRTLESALAFHLANRLSSPAMISTQIQSLISEALHNSPDFRKSLRADIMAVRDRDPACTCLPDVFLYFKGFHALQTHRVAHYMYQNGRQVLAHYLQSQVSQNFQIDIHPNATLGSGIMLDHGTGIVIGETATVGHNCSILHHVTLGGSGKKGVDRHPKVGNGVLLGAGASVIGNIKIGDGCQVGAGTLVITDLPAHSVAVGVPAKIIGSFVDVTSQPSIGMNQMTGTRDFDENIVMFESEGI